MMRLIVCFGWKRRLLTRDGKFLLHWHAATLQCQVLALYASIPKGFLAWLWCACPCLMSPQFSNAFIRSIKPPLTSSQKQSRTGRSPRNSSSGMLWTLLSWPSTTTPPLLCQSMLSKEPRLGVGVHLPCHRDTDVGCYLTSQTQREFCRTPRVPTFPLRIQDNACPPNSSPQMALQMPTLFPGLQWRIIHLNVL